MTDFEKYFRALQAHSIADITEHSHRSNLQQLLESVAGAKIKILHEPKREGRFGAPDFKVSNTESIIGYVENKKIEENLDKILKSEQIIKYQELSDNILLTNYTDWIWIKDRKIQQRETLCFLTDLEDKRKKPDKVKVAAVENLIKSFFSQAPRQIGDVKKLAETLAIRAKQLKDFLLEELNIEELQQTEGRLYQLYETFKSFVFHELTTSEFADAFAQNLVYSLFLAKLNADITVNLHDVKRFIPSSFELIRELVGFIDELENPEYQGIKWVIEEILTVLNNLDMPAIQKSLSFTKNQKDADDLSIKDPYVYFYEDFLAAYDKKLRKAKGVYYTPPPVVNFIVRAIDDILVNTFKIKDGLADRNKVTVLDFATGTGTFLVEVFQQILDKFPVGHGKNKLLAKEHILKNIFGFEYLIAPYTIAHLKLSQFLKDNGLELKDRERLKVFLTNTLSPIDAQQKIPLLPSLTGETKQAQKIKDNPVLIITGNPPYAYVSKNNGIWITEKMKEYYAVDGKPLGERNSKGLQDDYVKFIRFAQDKMDKVDAGIIGIITNHSFLDNPTYRGMRKSLMNSFNQIYIIDLHGNSDKKETTPSGGKDENVFDIKTGVAISIFIKKKGLERKVQHADFWGLRKEKHLLSIGEKLSTIDFLKSNPTTPFFLFKPQNISDNVEYSKWFSLKEIFRLSQEGVKTHRDHFVIDTSKEELEKRIRLFVNEKYSDEQIAEKLKLKNNRDWTISKARKSLQKLPSDELKNSIIKIQYRPFDNRDICLRKEIIDWPRETTMQHMIQPNLGLISTRFAYKKQPPYNYVFITTNILDVNHIQSPGSAQLFPLYLYLEPDDAIFKEPDIQYGNRLIKEKTKPVENFTKTFRDYIFSRYNHHFFPEEILGYIYAILYSPAYRIKYAGFLKIDFPRIPFVDDVKQFKKLAEVGYQLICTHVGLDWLKPEGSLLSREVHPEPDLVSKDKRRLGDYMGEEGNHLVEKIEFTEYPAERENPFENIYKKWELGIVKINKNNFFDLVPNECWEFQIGGYAVLPHFLKDRKGKILSLDELEMFEKTVRILFYTIQKMKEIDKLTKNWI